MWSDQRAGQYHVMYYIAIAQMSFYELIKLLDIAIEAIEDIRPRYDFVLRYIQHEYMLQTSTHDDVAHL